MKRNPLSYTIDFHNPGLTTKQIELKNGLTGGSDGLVILSEHFQEESKTKKQIIFTINGKTKESYSAAELWESYMIFTKQLTYTKNLSEEKKLICKLLIALNEVIKNEKI